MGRGIENIVVFVFAASLEIGTRVSATLTLLLTGVAVRFAGVAAAARLLEIALHEDALIVSTTLMLLLSDVDHTVEVAADVALLKHY